MQLRLKKHRHMMPKSCMNFHFFCYCFGSSYLKPSSLKRNTPILGKMHSCDILNLNFCKMFSFHYWLYHLLLCGHFIMGIPSNVPEKRLKQCWKDPSNMYLDPTRKVESNLGKILQKFKLRISQECILPRMGVFLLSELGFKYELPKQ